MTIPKAAKKAIAIGGLAILVVILVVIAVYWPGESDSGGYVERNPKKIIAHLEKILEVDFPEDIKETKAATTWIGWDPPGSYIIKFRVDPNVLESLIKIERLRRYKPSEDERGEDILPPPKWYIEPIQEGKMGTLTLHSPRGKFECDAEIYIDTSEEKSFVVYIRGGYY
jgi:hypothetical protein